MILKAEIYKDGKFWLAEIPDLDAMTQGKSRADAEEMLKDWIRSSLNDQNSHVIVHRRTSGDYVVITEDTPRMIALFLQRLRTKRGLTVREVAARLGFKAHNAYAQYEQGKSEPSISQLNKFVDAIWPGHKLNLKFG